MQGKEIEFKYKADTISLEGFHEFCKSRKPMKVTIAAGFDHFYANKKDPNSFCRYRVGADSNQLTFKRKSGATNYIRDEDNLDLAPKMTFVQVESLCGKFGYTHNFSIFKNCFIYHYDYYTLVYYICYDLEMKEIGRFVEIEMDENTQMQEEQCYSELLILEKLCKPLGITPQNRIKKSLYEMFRKES